VTRDLAVVAVANVFIVGAGFGVLRATGIRPALTDLTWTLGVGYLLGVAAVGAVGSALLVAGLALSWWQILLLCACVFAAGLLRRDGNRPPPGARRSGWVWALPAVALLAGAILAVDFAAQPLWTDDAWSIWAVKAHSIVELDGLNAAFLSSASLISADYPLLVPVLELVPLRFAGLPSELIPLQLGLAFLALPAALVALMRDRVPALTLWLVALAIVLAPTLQVQAASAVADVTLATFFALAGVAGWRWVEAGESAMLWLGGCFAAAAVATKFEGRAFVALLFLALVAAAMRRGRSVRNLVWVALAVTASALPWQLWSRAHGIGNAYSEAGGVRAAELPDTVVGFPGRRSRSPARSPTRPRGSR